jgi:hypothetical protein
LGPYRQWVLSLPFSLRLLLAKRPKLLGKVRTIFMRSVRAWQRLQAARLGVRDAKTAAVCFTQRFGSRLDCNPHFHSVVPDAVFAENEHGELGLRLLPKPTREDLQRIVERIVERMRAMRRKVGDEEPEPDVLDRLRAGSRQRSLPTLVESSEDRSVKLAALCDGFSLEAGRHLHENDRRGLEALLRYCLRPPLAQERLSWASEGSGELVLRLKRPMADGQTTLRTTPLEVLRRLAGLVPPPRVHQIHFFGRFASHLSIRSRVVPRSPKVRRRCRLDSACSDQLELALPAPVAPRSDESDLMPLVKAPAPRSGGPARRRSVSFFA